MDTTEKVRENGLRRAAKRLELQLIKSRARRWSFDNQQGYMMVASFLSRGIMAGARFDLNLDDVEAELSEREEVAKREAQARGK